MAGKTVEEATEHALDQLGVAAGDAEVIVVDEPKTGLFGRVRLRPGRGPASELSGPGLAVSHHGAAAAAGPARWPGRPSRRSRHSSGAAGVAVPQAAPPATRRTTAVTGRARPRPERAAAPAGPPAAGVIAAKHHHRRGVGESSSNGSGGPSGDKAPKRSTEAKETEDMAKE